MKQNITHNELAVLLAQLGLTRHGARIYLALLECGEATVAEMAAHARLLRPQVYRALPPLIDRALVGATRRGKRTYYSPLPPERLLELWRDGEAKFRDVLPRLSELFAVKDDRPDVIVLKGRKGIVAVYDDILATLPPGGVFYRYSSSAGGRKQNYYVPANYSVRRDAKKLERYVITSQENAARKRSRLERAIKTIPRGSDLFAYNITQLIYGGKIAFVDYNTETAIIITSPVIAQFQERLFKLLYQRL